MKTIKLLAFAILFTCTNAVAQNDAISKFFAEYENDTRFTHISVSGKLFDMASKVEQSDEEMKQLQELAGQVEYLKVLVGSEFPESIAAHAKALSTVKGHFEDLVTINDKNAKVNLMIREKNGIVSELFAVIAENNNFVLVSLRGKINLNDLSKVAHGLQNMGVGNFTENNALKVSEVKVYPNPASSGQQINIEIPEELNGAQLRVFNSVGKEVFSSKLTDSRHSIQAQKLGNGAFVLKIVKDNIIVERKVIVE